MKRRIYTMVIISIVSVFFSVTSSVSALGESIKITEIMYDAPGTDTDHEWVEIQNVSESAINLTGWKIYDGSNHTLNAPPTNGGKGSIIIPAGAFAVITGNAVTFLQDYPTVSGTVIDSVLSLSNTGDTIKIIDQSGVIMDEVIYTDNIGAAGDGNTLSWYQNGWVSAGASPLGYATNLAQSASVDTDTVSVQTTSFTDSKKEPVWQLEIIPSTQSVFAQVPFTLSAHVLNPDNNIRTVGKFVYTLGDGRKITTPSASPVSVVYTDPGTYIVHLDFYDAETDRNPILSDRLLLAVENTPIVIDIDNKDTRKIKLLNLHPLDIDLSGWLMTDGVHEFVFPQNTFLPGKKEVVLNPTLHTLNTKHLVLETPVREIVATYPSQIQTVQKNTFQTLAPAVFVPETTIPVSMRTTRPESSDVFTETHALEANAFNTTRNSWTIFFIIFLVIGSSVFFLLERSSKKRGFPYTE